MRTPDEIKKGLEYCVNNASCDAPCDECPYGNEDNGCKNMMSDALAYIQQLETNCHHLERERDAAVSDIEQIVKAPYIVAYCDYCKYGDDEDECVKRNCIRNRDGFEWRGVKGGNDHETQQG